MCVPATTSAPGVGVDCAPRHHVLSRLCSDILTFSHKQVVWTVTPGELRAEDTRIGVSVTPTLSVELDRSSPVPLYFQVAQVFEKAILDGQLKPGDRFENELALASRLSLSRPTTRRAIQELVDKGLLVRKRGVGTQVVQTPVHRPVELTSLFDDLVRAGQEPSTTVLAYGIDPAPADIAGHLNLPAGTDIYCLKIYNLQFKKKQINSTLPDD